MVRITNAVLGNKIDNLADNINEIKPAVRENTEFRLMSAGRSKFFKWAVGSGWILVVILALVSQFGSAYTPPSDIDMLWEYSMYNTSNLTADNITANNITVNNLIATTLYGDGSAITGMSTENATNAINATYSSTANYSSYVNASGVLNEFWIDDSDESNLNTNHSVFADNASLWDALDSPSDINAGDITDDGTFILSSSESYLNVSASDSADFWDALDTPLNFSTVGTFGVTEYLGSLLNSTIGWFVDIVATTINATYFFQNGNAVLDTSDEATLNTNHSVFADNASLWDALDSPSDINAGDITDDGTYILASSEGNLNVNHSVFADNATVWLAYTASTDITTLGTLSSLTMGGNIDTSGNSITNYFSAACSAGDFLNDIADDGTLSCATPAGGSGGGISGVGVTINATNHTNLNLSFTDIRYYNQTDANALFITFDSNASTACSGSTTYLDGEGNCDDISSVYVSEDTNASSACSGSTTYLDGEGNCDDISSVYISEDTNASSACSGATTYLNGDAGCIDIEAVYVKADTNASSICAGGTVLNGDATCDTVDATGDCGSGNVCGGGHTHTGYIGTVLEDTTPQLGGNLDGNGFNVSVDQGDFFCLDDSCSKYITSNSTTVIIFFG